MGCTNGFTTASVGVLDDFSRCCVFPTALRFAIQPCGCTMLIWGMRGLPSCKCVRHPHQRNKQKASADCDSISSWTCKTRPSINVRLMVAFRISVTSLSCCVEFRFFDDHYSSLTMVFNGRPNSIGPSVMDAKYQLHRCKFTCQLLEAQAVW